MNKFRLTIFVLIIFQITCGQESFSQNENSKFCEKIEILDNENGSTFLEFDRNGRLSKYDGHNLEKFYSDQYIKIKYQDWPVEFILDKKSNIPLFSYSFLENGDGFLEHYMFQQGTDLIETITLRGLESGDAATTTEKTLMYKNNNCFEERWRLKIGDDLVQIFEFKNSFGPHKNPFWGDPFQVLLGRGWDVGGFTNQNLPSSQHYTGKSVSSDEFEVIIEGTKTYSYNFDKSGSLILITIKTDETTTTIKKEDGKTSKNKTEKSQEIALLYNC